MARKQRGLRKPQQPGAPVQQRPQGGGGGGWPPLRDAVRRDVEQAVSALAFAERLFHKLDTQRRLFHDFPRVMEQARSGALERVGTSLSRLYEGGQGFDLQRFLRDLPLALAQLAAGEKKETPSQPPPAEAKPAEEKPAEAEAAPAAEAPPPAAPPAEAVQAQAQPVSPRVELRAKFLAAAPELAKAAAGYRRNVATVRRAALPRRSPGPWRADREVLEEARRAVEFVHKLYDTYAEAWGDQPLPADLYEGMADEADRFLAWTQLDRYVELAVMASTNTPRPPKPGHQIFSAPSEVPPPVTEPPPGAGGETKAEEPPPAEAQPVAEPEPGPA